MKTRVCIVLSDVDTSHLIETMGRSLDGGKYEVSFVFLGKQVPSLSGALKADGYEVEFIQCRGKMDFAGATMKMVKVLRRTKPDIVHTHLVNASIVGLTAARLAGVKKRIHTRHHSVETHLDYPHGVYYDRVINGLSTHIVAISKVVSDVLIERENVAPAKVNVIRHGFELGRFKADKSKVEELKTQYGLGNHFPVIGVISRHIHWKGVQYVVPAFREILKKYPDAKLVLANATGPYKKEIEKLLTGLESSQYVIIEFEKRVFELYKTFDVFVHVPIGKDYEAFGQVYVEALTVGVPSVVTLSGIANDFIEDRQNALVVPYRDSSAIAAAIDLILTDESLRRKIVEKGKISTRDLFGEHVMAAALDRLYSSDLAIYNQH